MSATRTVSPTRSRSPSLVPALTRRGTTTGLSDVVVVGDMAGTLEPFAYHAPTPSASWSRSSAALLEAVAGASDGLPDGQNVSDNLAEDSEGSLSDVADEDEVPGPQFADLSLGSPTEKPRTKSPFLDNSNFNMKNGSTLHRARSPRLVGKLADLGKLTSLDDNTEVVELPRDRLESHVIGRLDVDSGGWIVGIDSADPALADRLEQSISTPFPGLKDSFDDHGTWNSLNIDRLKYFLLSSERGLIPTQLTVLSRSREKVQLECTAFSAIRSTFIVIDGMVKIPDSGKPILARSGTIPAAEVLPDLFKASGPPSPRRAVSPATQQTSNQHSDLDFGETWFDGPIKVQRDDGVMHVAVIVRSAPSGGSVVTLSYSSDQPQRPIASPDGSPRKETVSISSTTTSVLSDSSHAGSDASTAAHPPYFIPAQTATTAIRIAETPGVSGGHGHVRRGFLTLESGERPVVLKFVERVTLPPTRLVRYLDDNGANETTMEIAILATLDRDGIPATIPRLLAWGSTEAHFWLALEPLDSPSTTVKSAWSEPRGTMDLFELIEWYNARRTVVPDHACRVILRQVAEALKFLHGRGYVHRDVKDENVIVAMPGFRAQLADFGSAAGWSGGKVFDTFSGTLDFAAPEILKGVPYEGPKQDVWSLGCLLFAMWTGENPFSSAREVLSWDGDLDKLGRRKRRGLDKVREVLTGCLSKDEGERWSAERVCEAWIG